MCGAVNQYRAPLRYYVGAAVRYISIVHDVNFLVLIITN